jgi:hypothetical protein
MFKAEELYKKNPAAEAKVLVNAVVSIGRCNTI